MCVFRFGVNGRLSFSSPNTFCTVGCRFPTILCMYFVCVCAGSRSLSILFDGERCAQKTPQQNSHSKSKTTSARLNESFRRWYFQRHYISVHTMISNPLLRIRFARICCQFSWRVCECMLVHSLAHSLEQCSTTWLQEFPVVAYRCAFRLMCMFCRKQQTVLHNHHVMRDRYHLWIYAFSTYETFNSILHQLFQLAWLFWIINFVDSENLLNLFCIFPARSLPLFYSTSSSKFPLFILPRSYSTVDFKLFQINGVRQNRIPSDCNRWLWDSCSTAAASLICKFNLRCLAKVSDENLIWPFGCSHFPQKCERNTRTR